MTLHLRVGQRHRISETLTLTVLATAGSTVKLGVAAQVDVHKSMKNKPPRGYYLFTQGEHWLVSWENTGDTLSLGENKLFIARVRGNLVEMESQQARAEETPAGRFSYGCEEKYSPLAEGVDCE